MKNVRYFIMLKFWVSVLAAHKFFINESKLYVLKKNKNTTVVIHGMITDYYKKPLNPKYKIYGINGIAYQKYYAYTFKDLLYYPIAYYKFLKICIVDILYGLNYAKLQTIN